MKYNVPYGLPDETTLYGTPYINGNPTTGTMGSIPPAASIEYDQREIVAVIQWAADHGYHDMAGALCANPTNADLQQLLKAIWGIINSNKLTAPKTYYVNTATGDDNNSGTSAGSPFKTIQRAVNQSSAFNLNGFSITIAVADGTYGPVRLPAVNGTGYVYLIGNQAAPGNCIIHANLGSAVIIAGGPYVISGFRFESDAADTANAIAGTGVFQTGSGPPTTLGMGAGTAVEFGFCADAHIQAVAGVIGIPPATAIRIRGNATWHVLAQNAAWIYTATAGAQPYPTLIIPEAHSFTTFIQAVGSANTGVLYSAITGKASVTGQTYLADANAIIIVNGGGANYYPGTVAGVTAHGGQYL